MKGLALTLVAIFGYASCYSEWDSYVDQLIDSGNIQRGAVITTDGSVLAKSANFKATDQELHKLAQQMKNTDNSLSLKIEGAGYFVTQKDSNSLHARYLSGGLAAMKANTVIVVGVYTDVIPGVAIAQVDKLADFLKEHGY